MRRRNIIEQSVSNQQINGGIDSNTLAMLHFDNASALTYDEKGNTWSNSGGQSSNDGYFSKCLYKAQNSSGSNITCNSTFNLGGDISFTIDLWGKFSGTYNQNYQWARFFQFYYGSQNYNDDYFMLNTGGINAGSADYTFLNICTGQNRSAIVNDRINNTPDVRNWNHYAYIYDGVNHNLKLYINGINYYSTNVTLPQRNYICVIGNMSFGNNRAFQGYIDEFRISNTIRWNTNFTPPVEPYF